MLRTVSLGGGPAWEVVEVEGQIVDSLILAKVLDVISNAGGEYRILDVDVGRTRTDPSRARLEVGAADQAALVALLDDLQAYGVNRLDSEDAASAATDKDGVFPPGFYSTTNLPTSLGWRVGGVRWRTLRWIVVWSSSPTPGCGRFPCIGSATGTGSWSGTRGCGWRRRRGPRGQWPSSSCARRCHPRSRRRC